MCHFLNILLERLELLLHRPLAFGEIVGLLRTQEVAVGLAASTSLEEAAGDLLQLGRDLALFVE